MFYLWAVILTASLLATYWFSRLLIHILGWLDIQKKEYLADSVIIVAIQALVLGTTYGLLLSYSDPLEVVFWPGILFLILFLIIIMVGIILIVDFALYSNRLFAHYIKYATLIITIIFTLLLGSAESDIVNMRDYTFMMTYPYSQLELISTVLLGAIILIIIFLGLYIHMMRNKKLRVAFGAMIIGLIVGSSISSIYTAEFAVDGVPVYWFGYIVSLLGIIYLAITTYKTQVGTASWRQFSRRKRIRMAARLSQMIKEKHIILGLAVLLIVLVSGIAIVYYQQASVAKQGMQDAWQKISYTTNISDVPITVDNLRLIDRDLAKDFISTFSLPSPPTGWRIEKLLEYEAEGSVEGKLAWIVPFRYQSVLTKGHETNKIAGFIWIYINETPLPENIMYEYYEMDIGPGLESFRDLYLWFDCRFPYYSLGEFYPVKINATWYWVVLADKLVGNVYSTEKVILIKSFTEYKVLEPQEALKLGIPQVISSQALTSQMMNIGEYLRRGRIDYTAIGVPLIEPESPDRLIPLEEDFYQRPHHFLLNNGSWFGRDFYMMVRISEKMKSVILITLINQTIKITDLRGYRRGELQGVSSPTNALSVLEKIADSTIGEGSVVVRYPKLYKFVYDNQTTLIWLALLVEQLPGGDMMRGAVFVDAVDTRIKGIIQYTFGEPRRVFISRLKNYIQLTYQSFEQGNQTTVRTGKIINGTVISKGWALEGSGEDLSYILTFRVKNDSNIVVIVAKEEYMESKEQWYLATTVKEGEHVDMDLRFDPERQVWMLYRIKILS